MAIITLTSDWGKKDYYAAAVKGTILSMLPTANIVDVTHEIEPFNVAQAGFTLRNCYRCFPPGTIHIIAVDTIESTECPHVVVKAEGQYFISTDNGIFSHILDGKYSEAFCIDVIQDSDFFTFATRDRFAKVAVMITTDKCYENRETNHAYTEDEPMGGYDPYSSSKGACEIAISSWRRSFMNPAAYEKHGKAIASVRAGNVIGVWMWWIWWPSSERMAISNWH